MKVFLYLFIIMYFFLSNGISQTINAKFILEGNTSSFLNINENKKRNYHFLGFAIGLSLNTKLNNTFGLELLPSYKSSYHYLTTREQINLGSFNSNFANYSENLFHLQCLDLPLYLNLNKNIKKSKASLGLGVYTSYLLKAINEVNYLGIRNYKFDVTPLFNRFDFGPAVKLNYQLKPIKKLTLGFYSRYQLSVFNSSKKQALENEKFQISYFAIGITISKNFKKDTHKKKATSQ